ncbi:choice-of-anchor C family protein [Chitinimonas arctica]|uniref:Choice-of-anchor C family protein n=1 Tax=Chitinimonas arctica TaxID=2594795 RepID=A0A516SGX7_9NEIS|nr:choice-of-anchor C family protein [Chitinimonas arctica]QDQ27416.1 choice-of-anchor C family protein [Chitinimonas arctica]
MKNKRLLIPLLFAFALAGQAQAAAFQNGDFEFGNLESGSFTTLTAGSNALTGWSIIGSVDWIHQYWSPSSGSRSLDLNGSGYGGVQQFFDTVAGQTYQVSFDLAGNPDVATLKTMAVGVGNYAGVFQFDTTGRDRSNMGWQTHQISFIAQGDTTVLTFASLTDDGNVVWGPALDNVKVTAVPEPEGYAMLGLGFAMVGLLARRRGQGR